MHVATVLLVPGDEEFRRALGGGGFEVREAADLATALRLLATEAPGIVIAQSLDAAREILGQYRRLPLILVAAVGSEELAVAALRLGVSDYLRRPVTTAALVASVRRCAPALPRRSNGGGGGAGTSQRMIGESEPVRALRSWVARVAPAESTVLITGETGTGKELVAQMIHEHSPRGARPFVSINCAAIPDALLESELFGWERGAFTGAVAAMQGKLKAADGGTVFFDEIGDMTPYAQAKLLRVIESKEVQRLGARGNVPVDIRIIAATNQDLDGMVAGSRFRRDLYFRLSVAGVHLPPLRERREDIPALLAHYVAECCSRFDRPVEGFRADAVERLVAYDWPGNVRELRNLVEATFVEERQPWIGLDDLPQRYRARLAAPTRPPSERDRLIAALAAASGNKKRAAGELGWSRMTLYRKLEKYGIEHVKPTRGS